MNGIFLVLFLLCAGYFLLFAPESFLPVLLSGATRAGTVCLSLVAVYCVWMGLMQVMEACGLNRLLSRGLRPAVKGLFDTDDEGAVECLSMNLSANMLGLSGAATPFGIRAAERLDGGKNIRYNQSMLFVLNATSVQILPTTVLGLLLSYGAADAYSIILPSLLSTAASTLLGVLGVKLLIRKDERRSRRRGQKKKKCSTSP